NFFVQDFSSGSTTLANERYGDVGSITKRNYPGYGQFFPANNNKSVTKEYMHTAKQLLPELVVGSDMINIVDE
ncbi:MAG TPA: hypothetical protein DCM40_02970, partial [Maribacter sp.]|nr:hypothetical protein [Maribacter sp.]